MREKYSVKQVERALKDNHGDIVLAAKQLGTSYSYLNFKVRKNKDLYAFRNKYRDALKSDSDESIKLQRERTKVKEKISDEQIAAALEATSGQPTKTAKLLGVTHYMIWHRIKKSPYLQEVKASVRSLIYQSALNINIRAMSLGTMEQPCVDEEGRVTGDTEVVRVDKGVRLQIAQRLMDSFRADDGIKDVVTIESKSEVDISSWIKENSK